jgi:hypothetical protein
VNVVSWFSHRLIPGPSIEQIERFPELVLGESELVQDSLNALCTKTPWVSIMPEHFDAVRFIVVVWWSDEANAVLTLGSREYLKLIFEQFRAFVHGHIRDAVSGT